MIGFVVVESHEMCHRAFSPFVESVNFFLIAIVGDKMELYLYFGGVVFHDSSLRL